MRIEPQYTPDLDWVKVSFESVYGEIRVAWERKEGTVTFDVSVPPNTKASIILPILGGVVETSVPYQKIEDTSKMQADVNSGTYRFRFSTK